MIRNRQDTYENLNLCGWQIMKLDPAREFRTAFGITHP